MTARQLLVTFLLGALAEITLLAMFVFLDEPRHVGGPAPHFRAIDLAYIAVPFLLAAAAALLPLRELLRRRRHERRCSGEGRRR